MSKKIKQTMFLDDLPKKNGKLSKIDWLKCKNKSVKFEYDDIIDNIKIIDVIRENSRTILIIKYKDIQEKINTDNFQKCKIGNILLKNTSDFKIEINSTLKNNKRDLLIINREYRPRYNNGKVRQKEKWYKYHCNKCGYEGWIIESALLKDIGCSCCCSSPKIVVENINSIYKTDPWMIPFIGEECAKTHTHSSNKQVEVICPDCGRVKSTFMRINTIYKKHSIACICSDKISYGEKFMINIFEQLKINFITQLSKSTFKWCNKYKYDLYFTLNNKYYICEVNGKQHYEDCSWVKLEITQENDKSKKQLALKNGINPKDYIVIDCRKSELEYIKNNILNSILNELFDLSKIDWLKAEEFALSNLVKKTCEIKRDNPNMTTGEIGLILKISYDSVRNYLKRGSKIWNWINYDAEEESLKVINRRKRCEDNYFNCV